jgi:hypothetical protein
LDVVKHRKTLYPLENDPESPLDCDAFVGSRCGQPGGVQSLGYLVLPFHLISRNPFVKELQNSSFTPRKDL